MDRLDDNKFAHLLQPIRDLAANWDINIANELEDYLVWLLPFIQGMRWLPGHVSQYVLAKDRIAVFAHTGCFGKRHLLF